MVPRWRPNFASSWFSLRIRECGVSPGSGLKPTTAFINGGDPGGQSTGVVLMSADLNSGAADNDCKRAIALPTISSESPRFDPSAMKTRSSYSMAELTIS
jgi:hypothetical protein